MYSVPMQKVYIPCFLSVVNFIRESRKFFLSLESFNTKASWQYSFITKFVNSHLHGGLETKGSRFGARTRPKTGDCQYCWHQQNGRLQDSIWLERGIIICSNKTLLKDTNPETQDWCQENLADFWPWTMWPPSSPDCTPLDYAIWGVVERKACATPHKNVDDLKASVEKEWAAM